MQRARVAHPELSQVLDNIINSFDHRNRRLAVVRSQQKAKHLSMTPQTVDVKTLQDFLSSYAPLEVCLPCAHLSYTSFRSSFSSEQLLGDRAKSRSLNLGRRVLTSIPLMHGVFSFFGKDQDLSSSESIKPPKSLLTTKLKALPHPDWTANHDMILLRAIYKHGFIDLDCNYRGMSWIANLLNETNLAHESFL